MSPMQIKVYQEILKQTFFKDGNRRQISNTLMQCRKACNHPYLFDNVEEEGVEEFGEHLVFNSGKMIFIDKLLQKTSEAKEQVLIFTQFTSMLNILEDFMMMRGHKYFRLDGETELEDREQYIEEFTRPGTEYSVFLISTRAGGLGINLVTANHVVLHDSDWNPQIDLQAMDRAYRIGQKKQVYVYRLIC